MNFSLNESQEMVQEMARAFAAKVLEPAAAELDRSGAFPKAALQQAANQGLLGVNIPAELGGAEAGALAYSLAITELGRACAATTVGLAVSNMVAEVVTAFGSESQRREHVPKLCSGAYVVGGFALSEAGAGSDPGGMRTKATRTARGWRINGSKLWITSGNHAKLFVVWARTNNSPGPKGLSAFLVPADTPGLRAGRPEEKMGQHGSPTTPLELDEVELGEDALLGEEGDGFKVAMMALDGGRIGIGSLALGLGLRATELARGYALERRQFGKPIARFDAIRQMLARSEAELGAARLLLFRAAALKEDKQPFSQEASIAKVYATERAFAACDRAIQVLGGVGYTREYPLERLLRDVRVTRIYEGTSEIQRIVISRNL